MRVSRYWRNACGMSAGVMAFSISSLTSFLVPMGTTWPSTRMQAGASVTSSRSLPRRSTSWTSQRLSSVRDGSVIDAKQNLPRRHGGTEKTNFSPRRRGGAEQNPPRLLGFFQLELGFVFFKKGAEIIDLVEQACPLFEIECDRETSQAINADAAFFADAELQRSGAFGCDLLFQFSKAGFHFFISRFCHVGSSELSYNKKNQNLTTETRRHGEKP